METGFSWYHLEEDSADSPIFGTHFMLAYSTLAQAGIKAEIITSEGKTLWPMYRARKHELMLARWSPDYVDPHSNADAFHISKSNNSGAHDRTQDNSSSNDRSPNNRS